MEVCLKPLSPNVNSSEYLSAQISWFPIGVCPYIQAMDTQRTFDLIIKLDTMSNLIKVGN